MLILVPYCETEVFSETFPPIPTNRYQTPGVVIAPFEPQAAVGSHDDVCIAWAIALGVLQGRLESKEKMAEAPSIMRAIFGNLQ